ncbi:GW dipeptide domain-containing protein [Geomonas sp. Red32]|uniref:GW dipeptide domain-containing protein n=1 Tax=Geomonas sp. Red32 TaxID=2912856 RepID=UPI00202D0063|nr:GW dipeptide domain-containing protein [Geomonas sp. Red32]MCM0083751.1 GW dipeptide domain-containing protein [Geomonas sp. Red32]
MMKHRKLAGITLALGAVAMAGCAGPGQTAKTTAAPASATAAAPAGLSGKVVETMDAGGYTYINLEKDGKKSWVAVPVTQVKVGDELNLLPGAVMNNFTSKSLNRTFESIVFSGGVAAAPAPAAAAAAAPAEPGKETVDPNESATPILAGKVIETMDAAQYTYINVEKDGKHSWIAVPATPVKVGDEIEVLPGTPMGKFTSKMLKRTFNAIYFSSGIKTPGSAAAPEAAKEAAPAAAPAGLPSGHPKIDAAKASAEPPRAPEPAPAVTPLTGKVVESLDAGGYTYLNVEKDGVKKWVAIPQAKIAVGEEVALSPGMTMSNFVSKGLNRTFEKIIFSNGPVSK